MARPISVPMRADEILENDREVIQKEFDKWIREEESARRARQLDNPNCTEEEKKQQLDKIEKKRVTNTLFPNLQLAWTGWNGIRIGDYATAEVFEEKNEEAADNNTPEKNRNKFRIEDLLLVLEQRRQGSLHVLSAVIVGRDVYLAWVDPDGNVIMAVY